MNRENEIGYRIRQILNQGVDDLDQRTALRLYEARQTALKRQRLPVFGLRLAALGHDLELRTMPLARALLAAMALTVGATGTYYWNAFEQARENEEIDSALLADELPPSAYLDRGFHAWLERNSDSPSQ